MTIFQLECFLEAVRQGSFAKASDNLYISQPTMSRQIRSLEEELQTSLFVREHNTIHLTAIGRELLPEFQQVYQSYNESAGKIREIVDQRLDRFRIGVLDSLSLTDAMRDAVQTLKARRPEAKISICHLMLREATAALKNGMVDVLFSMDTIMLPTEQIQYLQCYRDRMCLAVPADHPDANLPNIANEEIEQYFGDLHFALIAAEEFEGAVQSIQRNSMPGYYGDFLNKISGPFAELDSLMLMVHSGLGITCVNESAILKNNPRVSLIPLVDRTQRGDLEHEVYINAYWNAKNENPLLSCFVQCLKDTATPPLS